jgi:hypothetical protein
MVVPDKVQAQLAITIEFLLNYLPRVEKVTYDQQYDYYSAMVLDVREGICCNNPQQVKGCLLIVKAILESLKLEGMFNQLFP